MSSSATTQARADNRTHPPAVTVPFAAIVLAMLPAVLDQTILATALPVIASDLGSLSDVSWVVSAYVVAAAASTPLWGKLGDRHGRKRLLQAALASFVVASALCAVAQDVTQLIVFRLVQGAAAGGLMTLAMAAVGDLVAPRERGRYQGYIAATFAVVTIVGPLLGGVLVDNASWRWVFLVNLPLGAAALAGVALRLPASPTERLERALDVAGATLLAGATSALMLTCIWGGERYAWTSGPLLALIGATVVLSVGLVAHERRAADPIVSFHLLGTRAVAVASSALFLGTAALFSITVFVPLFLQTTTGASPTKAGLLLVPAMLGITVSTTLSGRSIARTGRYKRFPVAGLALMTAALALLAALAADPSQLVTGIGLALFGLGFGMVTQVLIIAVQNSVDRRELGIATAATGFFRALGGAVGAAVLGAVFAAQAGSRASESAVHALGAAMRSDLIGAVQAVFLIAAVLAGLALLVVLRLPELPLQTRAQAGGRSPGEAGHHQPGVGPQQEHPNQAGSDPVSEFVVETRGLTKRFGEVVAVDDLTMRVRRGEVYGFLGPNGAGKTTTLRMLLGLARPSSGEATVLDARPGSSRALRRTGAIVEAPGLYPFLSGRDNLRVLARHAGTPAERIPTVLEQVGLAGRADRRFGTYSQGMKQRLGVAAALLKDPELLVLDEPTTGLDPAGIAEMRGFIRALGQQGRTVLLSSHQMMEVEQICDRVGVLSNGTLIREGTVEELRGRDRSLLVHAEPLDRAAQLVAALPEVQAVATVGDALQITANPQAAPAINRALVHAGLEVWELRPRQASLEEVFLQLTRQPKEQA
jgi:EmrB/QacA subfamily drug resistance transporter